MSEKYPKCANMVKDILPGNLSLFCDLSLTMQQIL